MIVPATEAKTKCCPQSGASLHHNTCQATGCMAWVEQFDSVQTNGAWQRISSGLGFCGMVYKVSPKS